MSNKIWLDVDGVLCDLAGAVVKQYNTMMMIASQNIVSFKSTTVEGIKNWDWSPGIHKSFIAKTIFNQKDFWQKCRVYEGADDFVVRLLPINRNVIIVSNHHKGGFDDKMIWIDRHFGWVRINKAGIVLSLDKTYLFRKGDIVIDDSPSILNFAKDIGAIPICIDRPWNKESSNPSWNGERYNYNQAINKIVQVM